MHHFVEPGSLKNRSRPAALPPILDNSSGHGPKKVRVIVFRGALESSTYTHSVPMLDIRAANSEEVD